MVQDPFSDAYNRQAGQEIPSLLWNPRLSRPTVFTASLNYAVFRSILILSSRSWLGPRSGEHRTQDVYHIS
jgi:hypothetical protein